MQNDFKKQYSPIPVKVSHCFLRKLLLLSKLLLHIISFPFTSVRYCSTRIYLMRWYESWKPGLIPLREKASEKKPFSLVFGNCLNDLRKEEKQSISDCSVTLAILITCTNLLLLWGVSSGHVTEQHEQDRQEQNSLTKEPLPAPCHIQASTSHIS